MKQGPRGWSVSCALVAASAFSAAAHGQVPPKSPVHIAVNGVFFLCPNLVRDAGALQGTDLAGLGFEADRESRPGAPGFNGLGATGTMRVSYDAADKRCILDYGGAGYEAIAGVVRDMASRNGFSRTMGEDNGSAKSDVFDGTVPGDTKAARIIIVENYAQPSTSISYSEK